MAGSRQGTAQSRTEAAEHQLSRTCGKAHFARNSRDRNEYQKQDQSRRFYGSFLRSVSRCDWMRLIATGGFLIANILLIMPALGQENNNLNNSQGNDPHSTQSKPNNAFSLN